MRDVEPFFNTTFIHSYDLTLIHTTVGISHVRHEPLCSTCSELISRIVCTMEGTAFSCLSLLSLWMPRTLPRGNWYVCNDATVAKCSIDDALKAETYVAFYRKIEDGDWSLKMMHATAPSACRISGQVTQTQLPNDAPLIWCSSITKVRTQTGWAKPAVNKGSQVRHSKSPEFHQYQLLPTRQDL